MVEVPVWALIAFGIFTLTQLLTVAFLLRSVVRAIERNDEDSREKMSEQGRKLEEQAKKMEQLAQELETKVVDIGKRVDAGGRHVEEECSRIDKRFLEVQLANARMFVEREMWTRDYVTMSQRINGLHQRIDRFGRSKRPSEDPI